MSDPVVLRSHEVYLKLSPSLQVKLTLVICWHKDENPLEDIAVNFARYRP